MLFTDPFRDLDTLASELFGSTARRTPARALPMDAWRDDSALHLDFEVPGVTQDSISLEVDRGTLTVTVDKPVREVAGERLMGERGYGRITRSLTLGDGLNLDEVHATLDSGVLSLTIPLAEQVKPRKIAIEAPSGQKELSSASAE